MGARFFPADDLYITGTDDLLTNACNHHPVTASMIAQTTSFGGFAATVTVPEPTVTSDELGHGVYIDGTMLCLPPTAVNAPAGAADQPLLYPSPGDGDFRVDLPAGSNAVAIQLLDMEGRVVWRAGSVNAEVRVPDTLFRRPLLGEHRRRRWTADGDALRLAPLRKGHGNWPRALG
ncbi:MAG: hypothetical protein IPO17_16330 [Flavobacteriales bacterium]|nr:hypothetical protein [Flavobacteriales bacterium]